MSVRLEMLQVARLAPKLLGEAAALVASFVRGQQNPDGGFKDRTGRSDLYYTVFGLDALIALRESIDAEPVRRFLATFRNGAELDFVHACALARCWAATANLGADGRIPENLEGVLAAKLATFRARDGGFNPLPNSDHGTAYGAFLALGAHQDLHVELPDADALTRSVESMQAEDAAWPNEITSHAGRRRPLAAGGTNPTAAAVTVLRNLGAPVDARVASWLLARAHPQGGFLATPTAPMPDLLSTATALHALAGLGVSFEHLKEPCVDFVDSLWTNTGSFHGNWTDEDLDCEYTFYGLLALGHLSV